MPNYNAWNLVLETKTKFHGITPEGNQLKFDSYRINETTQLFRRLAENLLVSVNLHELG